jgi:hypothetical protein
MYQPMPVTSAKPSATKKPRTASGQRPGRADRESELIEKVHFRNLLDAVVGVVVEIHADCWRTTREARSAGGESLADSTTCSTGLASHVEPSMLRMKVETRVLDCATP